MSPETIRTLATEIAEQTFSSHWLFYVVLVLVTVVLSAAGAFLSSYFSQRGGQRAISTDFKEIKQQLEETTAMTEQVKVEINRIATRSEKLQWLKREKLEEYLIAVLRGVEYQSLDMYHKFFSAPEPPQGNPLVTASMLQKLYLPELDVQHSALLTTVSEFQRWVAAGMEQMTTFQTAGIRQSPDQSHMDRYPGLLEKLNSNVLAVEQAAKDLSCELTKV